MQEDQVILSLTLNDKKQRDFQRISKETLTAIVSNFLSSLVLSFLKKLEITIEQLSPNMQKNGFTAGKHIKIFCNVGHKENHFFTDVSTHFPSFQNCKMKYLL